MSVEREVLVSALKLTKDGHVKVAEISRETRIPRRVVCEVMRRNFDLRDVHLSGTSVELDGELRLRAAVRAIMLDADVERVCKFLTWAEFEDMSVLAFEANDFDVKKHFRFSCSGRRWEIDLLGLKEPVVASVDCKHWRRGWRGSASRKAAVRQIARTEALAEASTSLLERIGLEGWKRGQFVPIILSLVPGGSKYHEGVPIVPILQLRDFLREMPAHTEDIVHFRKILSDA